MKSFRIESSREEKTFFLEKEKLHPIKRKNQIIWNENVFALQKKAN